METALNQPDSIRYNVFHTYQKLLKKRRGEKAFHPNAPQEILHVNDAVFSLIRTSLDQKEKIICLTNVSNMEQHVTIELESSHLEDESIFHDILSDKRIDRKEGNITLALEPYQIAWVKVK